MSALHTRILIAFALLLVLGAVNYSIYGKERIIATGETIFIELAPVDPRSLMQGDYMALRFRLAEQIEDARHHGRIEAHARKAPLHLDEHRVATLGSPTAEALSIRFRIRHGDVWLGTNAYFFEEGTAQRYVSARYGEFRIDRKTGEAVLVELVREKEIGDSG